MGGGYGKRLVFKHVSTTAAIAAAGSLMVYIGDRASSLDLEIAGLVLVGLSPLLSYIITLKLYVKP